MSSIHNELTGRAGFIARAIRNALQINDPEVAIERVSETLQPTFNLWERPEWDLLRHERRWAQFNSATSAAGTKAFVGIANPVGSTSIVVVTSIHAYAEAAGVVVDLQALAAAGAGTPMFSTDGRGTNQTPFTSATVALNFAGTAPAVAGHIYSQLVSLAANDVMDFVGGLAGPRIPAFVVPPGGEVLVNTDAVGVHTLSAIFAGYERPSFAGELTARA